MLFVVTTDCFDSRWFPSCEVLTPCTTRRSESLARRSHTLRWRGLSYLSVERRKKTKTKNSSHTFRWRGAKKTKTKSSSHTFRWRGAKKQKKNSSHTFRWRGEKTKERKQLSYLSVERKRPAAISIENPRLPPKAKESPCSAHTTPWYVEYHAPP